MQHRITLSFRLIGPAACLFLWPLRCAAIHEDGTLSSQAVRAVDPSPVEPAPCALAPSATPMLLRIEDQLYRHDKSTAAAVLDSELTLFESRVDAAHARYRTLAANAALTAAIGGGLP